MSAPRTELLARGRDVLSRRRLRGSMSPATPSVVTPHSCSVEDAQTLLSRAVSAVRPAASESEAAEAAAALLELVSLLLSALQGHDVMPLVEELYDAARLVASRLEKAQLRANAAERAAAEARAETGRSTKMLDIYKKQLAATGAEQRTAANDAEVQRARAERDELRHSLTTALNGLALEKEEAERRATVAEAALADSAAAQAADAVRALATPAAKAASEEAALLTRWSSFVGEDVADEAVVYAARRAGLAANTKSAESSPIASVGAASVAPLAAPRTAPSSATREEAGADDDSPQAEQRQEDDGDAWPMRELLSPERPSHAGHPVAFAEAGAEPSAEAGAEPSAEAGTEPSAEAATDASEADAPAEEAETEAEAAEAEAEAGAEAQLLGHVDRSPAQAGDERVEGGSANAGGVLEATSSNRGADEPPLPSGVVDGVANGVVDEAGEPPRDGDGAATPRGDLLSVQIAAIMAQHAEDCKRMQPRDAGRLAMAALQAVHRQRVEASGDDDWL